MLMLSGVMSSVVGISLSILVMSLGWVLSFNILGDREKNSPFECGFEPMKSAWLPYSMRAFLFLMLSSFYYFLIS